MLAWLSKQNTLEGGTINFQADNEWGISITTITYKKKNQLISWKSQKPFFYNELIIMYFTNVCSKKEYTKRSSNTLLQLVYSFSEQTLFVML